MLHEPLLILDESLRIVSANAAFYATFRAVPEDVLGVDVYEADGGQWKIPVLRTLLEDLLVKKTAVDGFEIAHAFRDTGHRTLHINARRIGCEAGQPDLILLAIADVTDHAL